MDTITITNLKIYAYHGVYEEEKINGQNFYVNAKLYLDMEKAAATDDVLDSVHYGMVCEAIHEFLTTNQFALLETCVTETIKYILKSFPLLDGMEMELCKPEAPISLSFENVSVKRELFWHDAYIALGSNMGDKEKYIQDAIDKLAEDRDFRAIDVSPLITTKPYGGVIQDDFLNGVMYVRTLLSPRALLARLQQLEQEAKRERTIHWGPRTLDLDILLYDDLILDTKKLTIPHPDMQNRQFVLEPLCKLAPYLRHPLLNKTYQELLTKLLEKEE